MAEVEVKDASGKLLNTYTIHIDSDVLGTLIGEDVVCDTARRNAVADGLASEADAPDLTCTLVK